MHDESERYRSCTPVDVAAVRLVIRSLPAPTSERTLINWTAEPTSPAAYTYSPANGRAVSELSVAGVDSRVTTVTTYDRFFPGTGSRSVPVHYRVNFSRTRLLRRPHVQIGVVCTEEIRPMSADERE